MKKIISLLIVMLLSLSLFGCKGKTDSKEITVVYTNDSHTRINNKIKQDDGTYIDGLNFASVAALKKDLIEEGKNVILVDAGDHVQGNAYGSYDNGASIIDIMNAAGYDLATFGNHEFDYGFDQLASNMERADFDYVCANLVDKSTGEQYSDPYKIIEKDGVKVGFIGVTTPDTIKSSSTFKNGDVPYTLIGYEDKEDLYNLVQSEIDEIKNKVDYVVLVGHIGVDGAATVKSYDLIENTSGIDLFIDSHSHTEMESELVKDKDGNDVVLTQTGAYLNNIGIATLSKTDGISTKLISEYENYDEDTATVANKLINEIEISMGEVIGESKVSMSVYGETDSIRVNRAIELSIDDFVADAYYYYINETVGLECDVAIANGGSIKTGLNEGILTLLDANNIVPYGSTLMTAKIKGADLKQYLSELYADYDPKDSNGVYMEMKESMFASGLTFDVNVNDKDNVVDNIYVFNKEKDVYEPLDLEKEYVIAGTDHVLEKTEEHPVLANIEPIATFIGIDYMAISDYIENFAEDDGLPTVRSANSPLYKYSNFLIDYENLYGSGRVREVK